MSGLTLDGLLGSGGSAIGRAADAAGRFLESADTAALLGQVGTTLESLPEAEHLSKAWFQKSFGRSAAPSGEDLMAGRGLFYVTESRQLMLDCTAGHYQMTWGYGRPELQALAREAIERGVVWDNHSNIPSGPVKRLAAKLVEAANPDGASPDDGESLNTVLLGICTGTVACAAALKIALTHYAAAKGTRGTPVLMVLEGNYHGTDFLAQRLRGMWTGYFTGVEVVTVQPNDPEALERAFEQYGERIAAFWAELVMMNREAILLDRAYVALARRLCDRVGALMTIDEIQTGFWFPEVMMFHRYGVVPDFVVLGKGMTAGFHPLSALLYKGKLDCLAQYDAISTNGNAALAAIVGLGCIALIEREAERIREAGEWLHVQMSDLCAELPEMLVEARGEGHLTGLKFHRREDALGCHRAAVERGLWVRAHAYHPGHSGLLTKFALPLDAQVAAFTVGALRELLREAPWRR